MPANPADVAVAFARAQIGKPYQFGATGPNSYDCSGLVQAAYKAAGISISRVTMTQVHDGTAVAKANLLPGDLVFPDPGHVQIYSGNGHVIEAPHTGTTIRETTMWGFWAARRIVPGGGTGIGGNLVDTPVYNPLNPFDNATLLAKIASQVEALFGVFSDVNNVFAKLDTIYKQALYFVAGAVLIAMALGRMA
jgi:hypothetical protein